MSTSLPWSNHPPDPKFGIKLRSRTRESTIRDTEEYIINYLSVTYELTIELMCKVKDIEISSQRRVHNCSRKKGILKRKENQEHKGRTLYVN